MAATLSGDLTGSVSRRLSSASCIVFVFIVNVLASSAAGLRAQTETRPTSVPTSVPSATAPTTRKELMLDDIRRASVGFLEAYNLAALHWDDPNSRAKLITVLEDTKSEPSLHIGIGRRIAELDQRDEIPRLINLAAISEWSDSDREKFTEYVLLPFHLKESLVPHFATAFKGSPSAQNSNGGVARTLARLIVRQDADPETPRHLADRFAAMLLLFENWGVVGAKPEDTPAAAALAEIVGFARARPTFDVWQPVLQRFIAPAKDGVYPSKAELRDELLLTVLTQRNEARRSNFDAQVYLFRRSIETKSGTLSQWLLSPFADIRDASLNEFRSLFLRIDPEQLKKLIVDLEAALAVDLTENGVWCTALRAMAVITKEQPKERRAERVKGILSGMRLEDVSCAAVIFQTALDLEVPIEGSLLLERYRAANGPDRSKDGEWGRVRGLITRAAQLDPSGVDVAESALADLDAQVRTEAAVALEILEPRVPPMRAAQIRRQLLQRLASEEAPVVRERLVQSWRGIAVADPTKVTSEVVRVGLDLLASQSIVFSSALAGIIGRWLINNHDDPSLEAAVVAVLRTGLGHEDDAVFLRSIQFLATCKRRSAHEVLVSWFDDVSRRVEDRDRTLSRLLTVFTLDLNVVWRLAEVVRSGGTRSSIVGSVSIGRAVLKALERDDAVDAPIVARRRDAVESWSIEMARERELERLDDYFSQRLQVLEGDPLLLISRSAVREASLAIEAARRDLIRALDDPDLDANVLIDRPTQWRRLARLETELEDWQSARKTWERVLNSSVATAFDRYSAARVAALDPEEDGAVVEALFNEMTDEEARALGDRRVLVLAMSRLSSRDAKRRAEGADVLEGLVDRTSPLALVMLARAAAIAEMTTALSEIEKGATKERLAELSSVLVRDLDWTVRLLIPQSGMEAEQVRRRLAALQSIFPGDSGLEAIVVGESTKPAVDSAVQVEEWWRTRAECRNFIHLFLKQT